MKTISDDLDSNMFTLGSVARITDPCYRRGTWCCGTVATKPGLWRYKVVERDLFGWGNRVWELIAWHSEFRSPSSEDSWRSLPIDVGVDSGQCGIFDDESYPAGDTGEYGDPSTFYGRACEITLSDGYGVLGEGVVCRSGLGDGSYEAYQIMSGDAEEAVALKVVFIRDEEEEEDEDSD